MTLIVEDISRPNVNHRIPVVQDGVIEGVEPDYWSSEAIKDGDALFVQPPSNYQAEYPYNQVTVTEGGHTIEYDNTPNRERYRQTHPDGSYTETNSLGQNIHKSSSDKFELVGGNYCLATDGEYRVNIGSDETYYNLGNVVHQINGDIKTTIKTNETRIVEGNQSLTVKGTGHVIVEGDNTIEIKGNARIIINGNCDLTVNGNCNSSVKGDWNTKVSGNASLIASGSVVIDGSEVNLG